MLSPRYLEGLADEIVAIYSQLETDILQQMAGRLQRLGQITDKTEWQAQLLAELGTLRPAIDKIIKNYSAEVQAEIMRVWKEAMERNTANDNVIFSKELGRTMSENQAQALLSLIQKNYSDLSRLTLTTAQEAEQIFVEEANRAFMLTYSGAGNYNTAMKESSVRLAKNGITTVHYNNGKPVRRSIESAVRMNVLTAVNHSAANMTLNNCQQLGCDLVEVSAHQGARPEHAALQGKVYSLSGTHPDYPPFSVCGLGSATGICGINCRHSFYPYFPDSERHYTQKDLDKLEDEQVEWEGEKLGRYEAEQKLRHIERQIRHYKREAVVSKAAGIDDTASRVKLGQWQAKARAFTKATGLKRDSSREYIGVDGAQPRGLSETVTGYSENEKQAQIIKRLDNARKKVVANMEVGKPMNFQQADGGAPNPNYKKGGGYIKNCQTCVVAYELRRRGYNVEALPKYKGSMLDVLSYNTRLAWVDRTTGKTPDYIIPAQPTCIKAFDWLKHNIKSNNRYTIQFVWKKEAAGHIVHLFKNSKGVLSIYDPQSGINTLGNNAVLEYLKEVRPSTIKLIDVENCDINMNVANKILQGAKK